MESITSLSLLWTFINVWLKISSDVGVFSVFTNNWQISEFKFWKLMHQGRIPPTSPRAVPSQKFIPGVYIIKFGQIRGHPPSDRSFSIDYVRPNVANATFFGAWATSGTILMGHVWFIYNNVSTWGHPALIYPGLPTDIIPSLMGHV